MTKIKKTEAEWKQTLAPEQYHILREKGTEAPFSGEYYHLDEDGVYHCAACSTALFSSETKYDSGSGWPAFYQAIDDGKVELVPDNSLFMKRTEVICAACGGHLGHVFDDGPTALPDGRQATGKRYCINSAALKFKQK